MVKKGQNLYKSSGLECIIAIVVGCDTFFRVLFFFAVTLIDN